MDHPSAIAREGRADSIQSVPTSTSYSSRRGRSSTQSLLEKPLPSPTVWGSISMGAERAQHRARTFHIKSEKVLRFSGGWRFVVMVGAGVAVVVLIINVVFLAWSLHQPVDSFTGTRTLATGDCASMQSIFTYSHLAINVLSTILLATSNAAMQCLSAPTRESVDRAHSKGQWLDIGISGFRNWGHMDRWRHWCWMALMVSTIPLHLLYNSAIFSTTSANELYAIAVTRSFLQNTPASPTSMNTESPPDGLLANLSALAESNKLVTLDNSQCISAYTGQLVNQYSNVLLITKHDNMTNSFVNSWHYYPTPQRGGPAVTTVAQTWLCGDKACGYNELQNASNWNLTWDSGPGSPFYVLVDHCLAQPTVPSCTVQLLPEIMIIVIVCNIVKVICFALAVRMPGYRPLITLGDALASFLDRPDPYTRDLGPVSAEDLRDGERRVLVSNILLGRKSTSGEIESQDRLTAESPIINLPLQNAPWLGTRRRWRGGASRQRWGLTYVLMGFFFATVSVSFSIAIASTFDVFASQWRAGFGNVQPNALIEQTSSVSVFGNVVIANLPQIIVSLTYMAYNGLLTSMFLGKEFTNYARHRAGLRVSHRTGSYQSSSYWISLPYQYSLPLLILSGFLHWTLSQSLFLAEIFVQAPDGTFDASYSVSCLGFSSLALLVALLLGTVLLVSPAIIGHFRYPAGAPLVESNSIAISAACHSFGEDAKESTKLIKYGVLPGKDKPMRASLSSKPVEPLAPGEQYFPHGELDADTLKQLTPEHIRPTRNQKIGLRLLAFFNFVTLTALTASLLTVVGVIPSFPDSLASPAQIVSVGPISYANFIISIVALLYMAVQISVAIHRWRKKYKLRLFGWHVLPQVVFSITWLAIFATYVAEYKPAWLQSLSQAHIVAVPAVTSGLIAFSSLLSTGIEWWLWHQQHRLKR